MELKRILLPTDGSSHSYRAAQYAASLAKAYDGKIDIVYAIDEKTTQIDVLTTSSKYEIEKKRKQKFLSATELFDEKGIEYKIFFVHGEPGPAVVSFSNKGDYDCVIVGSRGLNRLQTMVLGSVSHKIVKRANAPVLVIK